jgi:Predicted transmembrane transcriptional regulator (anti-sigma factor)
MNCQEYRKQRLLEHENGALSQDARLHLAECGLCQVFQEEDERLRAELKKLANSEHAPAALRQRISEIIDSPNASKKRDLPRWMAAAAAVLLLAGATAGILWDRSTRTPSPEHLAQAFVTDHLEFLPGREQITAHSSRQAEEWLQSRIDFPVHVPQVPGTVLESARICDISGRKAALLQYRHADSDTLVSLFVTTEPRAYEREKMPVNVEISGNGLRSKLWCHRGLVYDVVAQVDELSLKQMADAVRTQAP